MKINSYNNFQKEMLERVLENLRNENARLRTENERIREDIANMKSSNSNKSKLSRK